MSGFFFFFQSGLWKCVNDGLVVGRFLRYNAFLFLVGWLLVLLPQAQANHLSLSVSSTTPPPPPPPPAGIPMVDEPYNPDEAVGILLTYKNNKGRKVAVQFPRQAMAAQAHHHHYNHSAFGREIQHEARRFRTGRITCPKGMAKLVMGYLRASPHIEQVELDAMVSARTRPNRIRGAGTAAAPPTVASTTGATEHPHMDDDSRILNEPQQQQQQRDHRNLQTSGNLLETLTYGMQMIQVDQVWAATALPEAPPASDIGICVVDTGYDLGHVDLPSARVDGWNPQEHSDWFVDGDGHGTHCTGTIAAVGGNGRGVAGVHGVGTAPAHLDLYIGKGLADTTGFGSYSAIIEACNKCVDAGSKVISLSLGGPYSPIFHAVTRKLYDNGILLVAAAGNEGVSTKQFPASFPDVISVGGVDAEGIRANFSHYNNQVELMAPGVDIYSTLPNDNYGFLSGTSMATPHVAGVAALLWSHFPNCTNNQIRNVLLRTTVQRTEAAAVTNLTETDLCNDEYGYGTIQAKNAYDLLLSQGCEAGGPVTVPLSAVSVGGCAQDPTLNVTAVSPGSESEPLPPPVCRPGVEKLLQISISTDQFPTESRWVLHNGRDEEILAAGPFATPSVPQPPVWACLPVANERYQFTMFDSFGDGMCCDQGQGSFQVYYDNELVGSGGEFFSATTVVFPEIFSTPGGVSNTRVPTPSPTADITNNNNTTTTTTTTLAPTASSTNTTTTTTLAPTTTAPTTMAPTTAAPTTSAPTTPLPTTIAPSSVAPSPLQLNQPFFQPPRVNRTSSPTVPEEDWVSSSFPSVPPTFVTGDLAPPVESVIVVKAPPSPPSTSAAPTAPPTTDDHDLEPPKNLPLPSTHNVPDCAVPSQTLLTLILKTNARPEETRWIVKDRRNVAHRIGGPYMTPSLLHHVSICLPVSQEPYTFTIYDSGGDGLCCDDNNNNDGAYALYYNGTLVASGDEFGAIQDHVFPHKEIVTPTPTVNTTPSFSVPFGPPSDRSSSSSSRTPTAPPTTRPTSSPTTRPTTVPTTRPTTAPSTTEPSSLPSTMPSSIPTATPTTSEPSSLPSTMPSSIPTATPTTSEPSGRPTTVPTTRPTTVPTTRPTLTPTTVAPTTVTPTTIAPTTTRPSSQPTSTPTTRPTIAPTINPTWTPTTRPSGRPTTSPTMLPSTLAPTTAIPTTSTPSTAQPSGTTCADDEKEFLLALRTDAYPEETRWVLRNVDSAPTDAILVSLPYTTINQRQDDVTRCLSANQKYEFIIRDNFGDGFCCSEGEGWYEVYYDGILIQRGGDFEASETVLFS